MKYWIFVFVLLMVGFGCSRPEGTVVRIVFPAAGGEKYRVVTLTGFDGSERVMDSGEIVNGMDSIELTFPGQRNQLYFFRLLHRGITIPFITDTDFLRVVCQYGSGKYQVSHSGANEQLRRFQDSLDARGAQVDKFIADYADTVSNPGLFLYAGSHMDFGERFEDLKKFVMKSSGRFPADSGVQRVARAALEYVAIYEEELKIGDTLSVLSLPDSSGIARKDLGSSKRYTFIDFWSSLEPGAHAFSDKKKQLRAAISADRLDMVSVAVDAEKERWKQIVVYENYDWPQLIDEKMWQGPTVRAYKFDSIPFNFLVDPDRKIIAKAIPGDSLVAVVSRLVK